MTIQRWIKERGGLLREQASRRIGIRVDEDKVLYYDIDADGSVYWLLPRRGNRLERRKVRDTAFADFIRGKAGQGASTATVEEKP